jgi:flagellar motor protein MotB
MTGRWQRRREAASHADDWLMTYADMITLLLCFFAIFLSVSTRKDLSPKTPARQPVEAMAAISPPLPPAQLQPPPSQPWLKLPDAFRRSEFHDLAPVDRAAADAADDRPAKIEAAPVDASAPVPVSLPALVEDLTSPHAAAVAQKGDRITTLEMSSAAFFDSGSAQLSNAGKTILQEVAVNLLSPRFRGYQITVEGHTDDTPINTAQFPSNWELSTARAAAVVRFFLEEPIPPQRLRAAGYADTFPKAPNRDRDGNAIPENQAQNRRVVIKLEKID